MGMNKAAGRKEHTTAKDNEEADFGDMLDDDSDDSSSSSSEEELTKNDMVLNGEDANPPMTFHHDKQMDLKKKRPDSDDDEPLMTAEDMLKVQGELPKAPRKRKHPDAFKKPLPVVKDETKVSTDLNALSSLLDEGLFEKEKPKTRNPDKNSNPQSKLLTQIQQQQAQVPVKKIKLAEQQLYRPKKFIEKQQKRLKKEMKKQKKKKKKKKKKKEKKKKKKKKKKS